MTSNKNEDEIVGLSNKNIRKEILLFKEEILKDIKGIQKEFSNKFNNLDNTLKEQINLYEIKVNTFEQKIRNLSNLIANDRTLMQKIEELGQFKDETRDKLLTESIKITNIESDYKMSIKNVENILSSTVVYPGLIGYSGKFKSFHDFMDYVLLQISELNAFKEKSIVELGPYKKKIDENLENIKTQVKHITNTANEFTIKKVNDCEQRMKSLFQLYDDRLQDTRVENAHYAIKLEKKSEEWSNLIKNIYEVRTDIYRKVKEEVSSAKNEQGTLLRLFKSYKKEFGTIKNKFLQLSEFIRDVRFRVNLSSDVQKKEFVSISKKLSFQNKANTSSGPVKKKSIIYRADTFDLNKKELNSNLDIFNTRYNNGQNKIFSNSKNFIKRNSLQLNNMQKFSNKLIDKFDSLAESKEENKNKKSSNNSSNKLIKINKNTNNYETDIFGSAEKYKKLNRRNTAAITVPNKFNKEFSYLKNFNNKTNNEIINSEKIKEENSLYSIYSSGEDKEKNSSDNGEIDKNKKNILQNTNNNNNKEKSEIIIKEEDENNISEITNENNKKKAINEIKNLKNDNKRKSKNINIEEVNPAKDNNTMVPKKEENEIEEKKNEKETKEENKEEIEIEEKKDEKKTKEENKEEIELNKENEIETNKEKILSVNINSEKNNNFLKTNNINKKFIKNKNFSAKILNRKDKSNNLQANRNEFKQKDNQRNNIISVVNINEMFMKNKNDNNNNKRLAFLNSPNNLYLALSQENNFLKHNQTLGNSRVSKNIISLLSKSNKTLTNSSNINSTQLIKSTIPYENDQNMTPSHLLIKQKFFGSLDNDMNLEQPYKTYSNFHKFNSDGFGGTLKLNSKIVYLSGKKKKINDITNNFLNKQIKKFTLKKEPYVYNYNKK